MSNMPNVPMNNPITSIRKKVEKDKYDPEFDRIFTDDTKLCECKIAKYRFVEGKMTCKTCGRSK